jgi:hypothetical protein
MILDDLRGSVSAGGTESGREKERVGTTLTRETQLDGTIEPVDDS